MSTGMGAGHKHTGVNGLHGMHCVMSVMGVRVDVGLRRACHVGSRCGYVVASMYMQGCSATMQMSTAATARWSGQRWVDECMSVMRQVVQGVVQRASGRRSAGLVVMYEDDDDGWCMYVWVMTVNMGVRCQVMGAGYVRVNVMSRSGLRDSLYAMSCRRCRQCKEWG